MDRYKQKTLKFMGLGKELRTVELHTARAASRNQRFSICRTIEDESETPKSKECVSKIPMFGQPQPRESARAGMLQKWKQEKLLKKQKEMRIQKPTFKVGVVKHNPPPVLTITHVGEDLKQNITRSQGASFRAQASLTSNSKMIKSKDISRNQGFNFRAQTAAASHLTEVKGKDCKPQPSFNTKSRLVPPSNLSTKTKSTLMQPLAKKSDVGAISNSKLPNKSAGIQPLIKKPAVGITSNAKLPNKDCMINKQIPTGSAVAKGISQKSLPGGVSKPVISRPQDKKISQSSSLPKSNISRLPPMKPLHQQAPSRGALKPPGASVSVKQTSIVKKTEVAVRQKLSAKNSAKPALPAKKDDSKSTQDSEENVFRCEISHIETVDAGEKSFAPKGFLFCAPIELNSSLYLDNGASAIFARIKGETQRTSTPKQPTLSSSITESEIVEGGNAEVEGRDESQTPDPFKSSDETKKASLPCESKEIVDCKLSLNFQAITDDSAKIQETKTVLSEINVLEFEPKDDSPESEKENYAPKEDVTPAKQFVFASPRIISTTVNLDSTFPISAAAGDEDSVFLQSDAVPADNNVPKIQVMEDTFSNPRFVTQRVERDLPKRSFRRSEKPKNLERINESPEDSTPKSHRKVSAVAKDFTPRRSMRLAKLRKSSSLENLLEVERPSMFGSPEYDKPSSTIGRSKLTYDFERLSLENESPLVVPAPKTPAKVTSAHARKVSLLYTPPRKGRSSVIRKSMKGDLMSFSPTV